MREHGHARINARELERERERRDLSTNERIYEAFPR